MEFLMSIFHIIAITTSVNAACDGFTVSVRESLISDSHFSWYNL